MPNNMSLPEMLQQNFVATLEKRLNPLSFSEKPSWWFFSSSFNTYLEYLERLVCLNPNIQYFPEREINICSMRIKKILDSRIAGRSIRETNKIDEGYKNFLNAYCLLLRILVHQRMERIENFELLKNLSWYRGEENFPIKGIFQIFKLMHSQNRIEEDVCFSFLKSKLLNQVRKKFSSTNFYESEVVIDFLSLLADKTRFPNGMDATLQKQLMEWFPCWPKDYKMDLSLFIDALVKNDYSAFVLRIFHATWGQSRFDHSAIINWISRAAIENKKTEAGLYNDVFCFSDLKEVIFSNGIGKESVNAEYIDCLDKFCSGENLSVSSMIVLRKDFHLISTKGIDFILEKIKELTGRYYCRDEKRVIRKYYLAEVALYQLLLSLSWKDMLNNEIFLNGLIIYVFSCDLFSLSDFLLVAEEKNRNVFPEAMSFLLNVTIEDEKCAKDNILHFVCSKKIVLVPYLIDSFYKQLAVIPEVVASSTRLFSESTLPKAMIATHIRKLGASIFPLISQMIQLKALMGTQALMFMEALIEKDTFCGFLGASCEHDLANAFAFCGDTFHSFFDKKEIFESSLEDKETFIFSLQSAAIKYHEEEIYHREINFFLTIKARFDIDFNQAKTMQEAIQMAARCESAIYALNLFFAGKYQITKEEFICFEKFYNHYKKINMKNSSRPRYQKPFEFFCSDFRLELQYLYFLMREQAFEFLRGFIASSVVGLDQFMRLIREMLNFISWSDKAFLAERRFIFSSGGFFDDGNHSEKKEFLESIMFLVIRDKSYIDEIEKIYFMHRLFSQKIATLDRLAAAFRRLRDGMGEIEGVRQIVIENLKSILNFFPTEKQITQIFSALLELEFLEVFSENSSLPAKQKFLSTVRPKYARTCLLDNIHQIMVALFIKEIQISPQCYKSKSDKISRGMLLSLLLGLWRTNGSGLGMLHRDLLRIFFEPEITFKQFVSNGVVDFPMSQCLSVYNKKIVEELEKHAIKTDFLLQYEKKSLFYAAKNKEQPREFFVEIWDKSQLGTFLLGKFVGCCLAPTGEYFYAIVQRCADIGMLFPVVIDQKSGEPIACNWAFFAKGNDEKIYLAINFFEIRANYARDGFLRNQIVDALFQFTQGYAGDVGVEAMLIRPLTYGNIPDFKGLPSRDLRIEKVGGFFKPTEYAADYYLDALACAQFYCVPAIRPPNVEVHLSGNNNGLFHHANQSSDNASHVEMSVVAPK